MATASIEAVIDCNSYEWSLRKTDWASYVTLYLQTIALPLPLCRDFSKTENE